MQKSFIKNFDELATTENRKLALTIVETGLNAINTEEVVFNSVKLTDNNLLIQGKVFDLSKFKKIKVVGFGKASCVAAFALEKILGKKIKEGAVIGLKKVTCEHIETFIGTHPRPSTMNISAGKKISEIADQSKEDDLVIVIVSGGGSALLCSTESECEQGQKLYDSSIKCGEKITEINTVRKHLSLLKGGGLAKLAYPATVVGLIFSDVPGDNFDSVASGPTYQDKTTMQDAEKIIHEHNLGDFILNETSKDDKYFEKVHNFVLVSNKTAVEAMKQKSLEMGFQVNVVSTELYDEIDEVIKQIFSTKRENAVVLGAGEPEIDVKGKVGKGGRNLHMGLRAIKVGVVDENSVFISFASDGMDNTDEAGAVVDKNTIEKIQKLNLDVDDYLNRFDSYNVFLKTNDMIMTGPTGANVSDLMILLTKK